MYCSRFAVGIMQETKGCEGFICSDLGKQFKEDNKFITGSVDA